MPRVLGLDIEDHVVRGVLARTSFGRIEPLRYLEVPVRTLPQTPVAPTPPQPPAAVDTQPGFGAIDPLDPRTVASGLTPEVELEVEEDPEPPVVEAALDPRREAIAELLEQIRPHADALYIGMDGKEASLRTIEVPAGAAKKGRLGEVLPFELDDLVPFDIDDAMVDHQVISDDGETVKVLATAVPKERILERLSELRALGIDPRGMPVGAAALDGLCALVPVLAEDGPHLVVEMEHDNTEFCVIDKGTAVFARSLPVGVRELFSKNPQASRARLSAMLRRTFGAYRAGGGAAPVSSFFGGDAIEYAAEVLEIFAQPMPGLVFEPVPMPAAPGADELRCPRFARAAALAGRSVLKGKRIDLRQGEFAQQRAMGELRQHARLLTICVAVLLVSFIFSTYARYSVLADENEQLTAQLAETTEQIFDESTENVDRARNLLESGRQVQDPLPTMDAYEVLDQITAAIPTEIDHKTRRLTIEIDDVAREGRIDLQGTVASIAERDTIAANIESHECFRDLEKGPTSPGPGNEGLNYRLEVNIQCPGDEPLEEDEGSRRRGRN